MNSLLVSHLAPVLFLKLVTISAETVALQDHVEVVVISVVVVDVIHVIVAMKLSNGLSENGNNFNTF